MLILLLAAACAAVEPCPPPAPETGQFTFFSGNCRLSPGAPARGGNVKKGSGGYDPEIELKKGAELSASSYDKTQGVEVTARKVTIGGLKGVVEFRGTATGKGPGIEGTINVWLSIFRYTRPDGTVDHVAGWNIAQALKPGMTALQTAIAFETYINSAARPYQAKAYGDDGHAALAITYKAAGK